MLIEKIIIQEDTIVAEVLDTWPQTIPFFIKHRMDCIGCPMASFCALEEVAQHYELNLHELIQELTDLTETEVGGNPSANDARIASLVGVA